MSFSHVALKCTTIDVCYEWEGGDVTVPMSTYIQYCGIDIKPEKGRTTRKERSSIAVGVYIDLSCCIALVLSLQIVGMKWALGVELRRCTHL